MKAIVKYEALGLNVELIFPKTPGHDFNDMLTEEDGKK
jgi:hypothetical protein